MSQTPANAPLDPDGDPRPERATAAPTGRAPRWRAPRWRAPLAAILIFAAGVSSGAGLVAAGPSTEEGAGHVALRDGVSGAPLGPAPAGLGFIPAAPSASTEVTTPADAPEDIDLFWDALDIVRQSYVDRSDVSDEQLVQGAIRGMVESLGDTGHSVYLTPDEVQAERDALDGRVIGIGVVVDQRAGAPVVISVIDGSPADTAGLRAGDVIREVDGVRTERLGLDQLLTKVRGPQGSTVRLGVERAGEPSLLEVEVTREVVTVPPVAWAMVPGTHVADVRLVQFSQGAGRLLREAVGEALEAGADALVLDLRGNPGGLVQEATSVAGAFLEGAVAFREQDQQGHISDVPVRGRMVAAGVALVVLVDYGSASSAEIVAAALQEHGRAPLVGEQTYGTGTVLSSFGLRDGSAVRLGISRWLTPDGSSVFGVGVGPDEDVELAPGAQALEPTDLQALTPADYAASGDRQLERAVQMLTAPAPANGPV